MKEKLRRIGACMFRLSWPAVTEQTLVMIVSVLSLIVVGMIDKSSIAAMGAGTTLGFFIQALYAAPLNGVTVLVARMAGEGDECGQVEATKQSLLLLTAISVLVLIVGFLTAPWAVNLFIRYHEPQFPQALLYYKLVILSTPALMLQLTLIGALRGAGSMRLPMVHIIFTNVFYLLLIFLMSIGPFGLPKGGLIGAGLAINIARYAGAALTFAYFFLPKCPVCISFKEKWRVNFAMLKRMMVIGMPSTGDMLMINGGFIISQSLISFISSAGVTALTLYQIGNNANSIIYMPINGLALAATTLVGQELGKRNLDDADFASKAMLSISMGMTLVMTAIVALFIKPLALVYSNADVSVAKLSEITIGIFLLSEPFLCIYLVMTGVLKGAGDMRYLMLVNICGLWVVRIPLIYIMMKYTNLGVQVPAITLVLDFVVRAVMLMTRLLRGKWKYIRV